MYKSELNKDHFKAYQNDETRWKKSLKKIQHINLRIFSNIGTLIKTRKKRKKLLIHYHLRISLSLQDKENPVEHTRNQMKIQLEKLRKWRVLKRTKVNGDESINAFASIMGPELQGRLRLYGREGTKTSLKGKVGHFEPSPNATDDHMQKMEEKMIRLEEKIEEQKEQFEEQKTMMRQEIVEDIIAKLQRSGLPIDANIQQHCILVHWVNLPQHKPHLFT